METYRSEHSGETIDNAVGISERQGVINERFEQHFERVEEALDDKVDKVAGKRLSTNDYTDEDKQKLLNLPTGERLARKFEEINSAIDEKYEKPAEGIPRGDLSSTVKDSLDKADTALQQADIEHLATKEEVAQSERETKQWVEGQGYIKDVSDKEDKANKVQSIGAESTEDEYPSAKAVHSLVDSLVSIKDDTLVFNID